MSDFRAMLIVNPNSANGATKRNWREIEAAVRARLPVFDTRMTERPGDATTLARQAIHAGYEMIVSVGGDGTNNEIVNGFFENDRVINPEAVFATIPQGTGGDFRRTIGVPRDFREAAAFLPGRDAKRIDVGRMTLVKKNGEPAVRYFINIASFGVGGLIDDTVNRTTKALGGFASFLMGSVRAMAAYKNQRVRVRIDGRDLGERTIFSVAVANGRYFGGGMMGAPNAEIDDGLFDVLVMGDLGAYDRYVRLMSIYKGEHLKMAKIETMRAKCVEAEADEPVYHDVDGEGLGTLPSRYDIQPSAIRLKLRSGSGA